MSLLRPTRLLAQRLLRAPSAAAGALPRAALALPDLRPHTLASAGRSDPLAAHAALAGDPDEPVRARRQPARDRGQPGGPGLLRQPRQLVAGCAAVAGGGTLGHDGEAARGGPGGRDLAAAGGPAAAGGRGPGHRRSPVRPTPHGVGLQLDGLFPGVGGPRRAHTGHRRRPRLPQGPAGLRAGPAAVRGAHAAHGAPAAAAPAHGPADPGGRNRATGDGATGVPTASVGRPAAAGLLRVGPPGRDPAVTTRAGPGGVCHGALERPHTLRARPLHPLQYEPAGGMVWTLQAPGAAGPRPEDAAGAQAFLHLLAGHLA